MSLVKIYTHESLATVNIVRGFLESHGVFSVLRNQHLSSVMGDIPFFETWPEIWVAQANETQAKQVLSEWVDRKFDDVEWLCTQCNESNPGTFEICWSCSTNRPASA